MKKALALAALALVTSCKSTAPEKAATPTPAVAIPAKAARAAIPDADVTALVDRWVDAQNKGDFAAYQALYATRFTGVRRSGSRSVDLDRDGWIADRAKMFKKKMTVSAADVDIASTSGSVKVELVQTWASGSYKDVGPKQMVFVKEKGALKIAREEMLLSIVEGELTPDEAARGEVFFLFDGVPILDEQGGAEVFGKGSPTRTGAHPAIVKMGIDAKVLPEEMAVWKGKKLALYDAKGPVCVVEVTGFELTGGVDVHFGTAQAWEGTYLAEGEEKMSEEAVAAEAFELARVYVGAVTRTVDGNCTDAQWARAASAKPAIPWRVEGAPKPVADLALAALRKLPAWEEAQTSWKESPDDDHEDARDRSRPWDEGAAKTWAVVDAGGKVALVGAFARAGHGCGGFYGDAGAIWAVTGTPEKPVLTMLEETAKEPPTAAFDLGGDGFPELLWAGEHESSLAERTKDGELEGRSFAIPFLDCPC